MYVILYICTSAWRFSTTILYYNILYYDILYYTILYYIILEGGGQFSYFYICLFAPKSLFLPFSTLVIEWWKSIFFEVLHFTKILKLDLHRLLQLLDQVDFFEISRSGLFVSGFGLFSWAHAQPTHWSLDSGVSWSMFELGPGMGCKTNDKHHCRSRDGLLDYCSWLSNIIADRFGILFYSCATIVSLLFSSGLPVVCPKSYDLQWFYDMLVTMSSKNIPVFAQTHVIYKGFVICCWSGFQKTL